MGEPGASLRASPAMAASIPVCGTAGSRPRSAGSRAQNRSLPPCRTPAPAHRHGQARRVAHVDRQDCFLRLMPSSVRVLCALAPSGNGVCLATYPKALSPGFPAPIPVIAVRVAAEKNREVSLDQFTGKRPQGVVHGLFLPHRTLPRRLLHLLLQSANALDQRKQLAP